MNSLTSPLLHFVWQGAIIASALWLALRFAQSSRTRYALASAALLLMALTPIMNYWDAALSAPQLAERLPGLAGRLPVNSASPSAAEFVWLPYLWLAGVALCSIRVMRAALATQQLQRGARTIANPCPQLFDRAVRIVESVRVKVPAQLGVLKPVILLPLGMAMQLPAAQLEAILAHELAHIRRHDYLVNLLQVFVETLLFYHPGVWWVSQVMRREREHCADDLALAMTRDPHAYASALLTLEEARQAGFATAANGGDLKTRIERALAGSAPERGSVLPAVLALALAFSYTVVLRAQAPTAPQPAAAPIVVQADREIADLKAELKKLRAEREHTAQIEAEVAHLRAQLAAQTREPGKRRPVLLGLNPLTGELLDQQKYEFDAVEQALVSQLKHAAKLAAWQAEQQRREARRVMSEQATRDQAKQEGEAELAELQAEQMRQVAQAQQVQADKQEAEHRRRIAYANEKWSTKDRKGSETPRGRVYVESGPPDELEIYKDKSEAWLYRTRDGRIIQRFDSERNLTGETVEGKK